MKNVINHLQSIKNPWKKNFQQWHELGKGEKKKKKIKNCVRRETKNFFAEVVKEAIKSFILDSAIRWE